MAEDNTLSEDDELEIVETDTLPERVEADDEPEEDARLAESEDDGDENAEDEEKFSKNRKKRRKRRKLRKAARDAQERELRILREQNELMLKRLSAVEGNAVGHNELLIDQKLTEAQREIQQAEMIMARAIEAGNGEDAAAALKLRDEAQQRMSQIGAAKVQLAQAKQQASQAPGTDPRVTNYAREWMDANKWYNPNGTDEASAITNVIDKRLMAEGYDPRSYDYWKELTKRVSARLGDDDGGKKKDKDMGKRKGPPVGSGREHAPQSTKKEVYVTPERKQAMIDAGIWDDPVRRNQMLKAYRDYDRNAAR